MRDHMRIRHDHMRFAALSLALLVTGCGASRMERMTMVAGALHEVASGTAPLVEAAAARRGEMALASCPARGEECARAVDAAVEELRPAEASQHLFAAAVDAFVGAVLVAAQSDSPDWGDALRLLGHALDIYEQMRVMLQGYGITAPHLPDLVADVLGAL